MSSAAILQFKPAGIKLSRIWKLMVAGVAPLIGVLALNGCATSPFSDELRQKAKPQPDFTELRTHTDTYLGWSVILGGTIIKTTNLKDYTAIEVLQKPLDSSDRPQDGDLSQGRFLIHCKDFLDPAVFEKGREISVAGKVEEKETAPLGDITYTYPVISCDKLNLWQLENPPSYYYPQPYWYDQYYYPYYRPAPRPPRLKSGGDSPATPAR